MSGEPNTPPKGNPSSDLRQQAYRCPDKHVWIAHGKFVTDKTCPFCRKEGKKFSG